MGYLFIYFRKFKIIEGINLAFNKLDGYVTYFYLWSI